METFSLDGLDTINENCASSTADTMRGESFKFVKDAWNNNNREAKNRQIFNF
jgi:hypothetical protein